MPRSEGGATRPLGFYLPFGSVIDEAVNERVHELGRKLLSKPFKGVTDVIPGYTSLYIEFDSSRLTEGEVRRWIEEIDARPTADDSSERQATVEIPVVYNGEDLETVASSVGLDPAEVAKLHAEPTYRVYASGFLPGFPFLGEVKERIRSPRHSVPRKRVPAHSLAMAGRQTGVYPLSSPGGWQLLGHSLVALFDPKRERPFLVEPGDKVRFVPQGDGQPQSDGQPPAEPAPLELLPGEPVHPTLLVREPGLLDLVLDGGREMMGRFGLSRTGPLDSRSARLANVLLGNPGPAPMLELNLHGPVLECLAPVVVAFAGYGLAPRVNGEEVQSFRSFALAAGDVLSFASGYGGGCRGYLAVAGGLESGSFAGSASVDLRGLISRPLRVGDLLGQVSKREVRPGHMFTPYRRTDRPLRLLPGPQASREALRALTDAEFTIASANRTGLRFSGPEVPGGEVLSEAVPIGALQVPPSGEPILLLNDRGSLGGYAKPALLHPDDLPLAGQLRAGSKLRFEMVEEAWGR